MEAKFCKLDLVPCIAFGCYVVSVLPFTPRVLSGVTGVALCFVLTGIAGSSALLPRGASGVARFTAAIACIVGTAIVGGLILTCLPSGLDQFNWVTYAFVVTLIGYAIARARGAGSPLDVNELKLPTLSWLSAAKLAAAAVAVGAALVISISSSHHGETPFTEVWLVPDGPSHSPVGAKGAVFGIKSHERTTEDFVVVMNSGQQVTTHRVTLAPNQVWTQSIAVTGSRPSADVYRGQVANAPYRTVWFVRK
jgi:hypothetical protein